MRSVAEHLQACLSIVGPLPPLGVDLENAVGCVLASDIIAHTDLPLRDLAALDGYAINTADIDGLSLPIQMPVSEDIGAGVDEKVHLLPRTCIRLAAGAPVPVEANMVVPVEFTDMGSANVTISQLPPVAHIRRHAEDVVAGDVLMQSGERVGARQVALLAACGYGRLPVHPAPRVVVVTIGSELVAPGDPLRGGQVFDADSHAISNAVQEAGAMVYRVSGVPDETRTLREVLQDQLVRADMVITTGGIGYGLNDTVKEALSPLGTVRFDNVAMNPGRQFGAGRIGPEAEKGGGVPVFCLPGNPIEALVAFEVFVRPALRKMSGRSHIHRLSVRAQVTRGWRSIPGRRQFVCVYTTGNLNGYQAEPVGNPERALMSSFARANGLAVVPENITEVRPGDYLPVLLLDK